MTAPAPDPPVADLGSLGVVDLVAGMLLCFLGVRSVKLATGCAGFGLGVGLATALGGGAVAAFLVGAAVAVGALVLVTLVVRLSTFVIAALAGGVFAASAHRTLPAGVTWRPTLVVLVVVAVALLAGTLAHRLRHPLLRGLTALAGAALVIRGVVEAGPAFLGFLRSPATWVESLVALAALLALAWAGYVTQRGEATSLRR